MPRAALDPPFLRHAHFYRRRFSSMKPGRRQAPFSLAGGGAAAKPPAAATKAALPAPTGASQEQPAVSRERLVAPPERHLDVSDSQLLACFQEFLGAEEEVAGQLATLQRLLQGMALQQQAQIGREMLEAFGRLSAPIDAAPSTAHTQPEGSAGRGASAAAAVPAGGKGEGGTRGTLRGGFPEGRDAQGASPQQKQEDLQRQKQQEDLLRFLRQLSGAMSAARYHPLLAGEWNAALCENFLFTLPVTANYSSMDPSLLPPAWPQPGPRQLAGRALMWHRGAQAARAATPAWALKLDILLSFWLLQPLWAALAWLLSKVGLRPPVQPGPGISTRPFADPAADAASGPPSLAASPAGPAAVSGGMAGAGAAEVPGASSPAEGSEGRVIERCTFARAFPNSRADWRQLTRPVQLQEACYSDVVLMYRPAGTGASAAVTAGAQRAAGRKEAAAAGAAAGAGRGRVTAKEGQPLLGVEESVGGASDEAHLVLKQFRQVPLADLEMVLPGASVFLPPNLYLSLAFTLLAGLAAAAVAVWQGTWGAGLLKSVATILLTRAYQVYTYVTNERTAIIKHMTQMLYERTAASQSAVLHTLNAELAGQRARELLLCYCVLVEAGAALSEREVGRRGEALLARRLGLPHIQLDAGPPLRKLRSWGLAEPATGSGVAADATASSGSGSQQQGLVALAPAQAVQRLQQAWASLAAAGPEGEAEEGAGSEKAGPEEVQQPPAVAGAVDAEERPAAAAESGRVAMQGAGGGGLSSGVSSPGIVEEGVYPGTAAGEAEAEAEAQAEAQAAWEYQPKPSAMAGGSPPPAAAVLPPQAPATPAALYRGRVSPAAGAGMGAAAHGSTMGTEVAYATVLRETEAASGSTAGQGQLMMRRLPVAAERLEPPDSPVGASSARAGSTAGHSRGLGLGRLLHWSGRGGT